MQPADTLWSEQYSDRSSSSSGQPSSSASYASIPNSTAPQRLHMGTSYASNTGPDHAHHHWGSPGRKKPGGQPPEQAQPYLAMNPSPDPRHSPFFSSPMDPAGVMMQASPTGSHTDSAEQDLRPSRPNSAPLFRRVVPRIPRLNLGRKQDEPPPGPTSSPRSKSGCFHGCSALPPRPWKRGRRQSGSGSEESMLEHAVAPRVASTPVLPVTVRPSQSQACCLVNPKSSSETNLNFNLSLNLDHSTHHRHGGRVAALDHDDDDEYGDFPGVIPLCPGAAAAAGVHGQPTPPAGAFVHMASSPATGEQQQQQQQQHSQQQPDWQQQQPEWQQQQQQEQGYEAVAASGQRSPRLKHLRAVAADVTTSIRGALPSPQKAMRGISGFVRRSRAKSGHETGTGRRWLRGHDHDTSELHLHGLHGQGTSEPHTPHRLQLLRHSLDSSLLPTSQTMHGAQQHKAHGARPASALGHTNAALGTMRSLSLGHGESDVDLAGMDQLKPAGFDRSKSANFDQSKTPFDESNTDFARSKAAGTGGMCKDGYSGLAGGAPTAGSWDEVSCASSSSNGTGTVGGRDESGSSRLALKLMDSSASGVGTCSHSRSSSSSKPDVVGVLKRHTDFTLSPPPGSTRSSSLSQSSSGTSSPHAYASSASHSSLSSPPVSRPSSPTHHLATATHPARHKPSAASIIFNGIANLMYHSTCYMYPPVSPPNAPHSTAGHPRAARVAAPPAERLRPAERRQHAAVLDPTKAASVGSRVAAGRRPGGQPTGPGAARPGHSRSSSAASGSSRSSSGPGAAKADSVTLLGKYLHLLVPEPELSAYHWGPRTPSHSSGCWWHGTSLQQLVQQPGSVVHATWAFAGAAAESTLAYAGATAGTTLAYAGATAESTLAYAGAKAESTLAYAGATAGTTLAYAGATAGTTLAYAGATAGTTLAYAGSKAESTLAYAGATAASSWQAAGVAATLVLDNLVVVVVGVLLFLLLGWLASS